MMHAYAQLHLVFALLHHCSAVIQNNNAPEWFSANAIGDFSPIPLTEIFSTEKTFSTTNPIIVAPPTTQNSSAVRNPNLTQTFSTPPPTFSTSPNPTTLSSFSTPPPTFSTPPSTFPTSKQTFSTPSSTFSTTPFTRPTQFPNNPPTFPGNFPTQGTNQPNNFNGFVAIPGPGGNPSVPPYFYLFPPAGQPQQQQFGSQFPQTTPGSVVITPVPNNNPTTNAQPISSTPANIANNTRPTAVRIRMLSPTGTITNINVVNGQGGLVVQPSTMRTTTRRNRRRNTYDNCVDTCGDRRRPVCAAPAGVRPFDADTLRGFPTMCHLACHNSYRREAYERVADGRCGRLRTRIVPLNDDRQRLRRPDLNRAQYTISDNQGTVIQVNPVRQKK